MLARKAFLESCNCSTRNDRSESVNAPSPASSGTAARMQNASTFFMTKSPLFDPVTPSVPLRKHLSTVNTVRGPIAAADLGVTLMHEHIFVLSTEIMQNYPETCAHVTNHYSIHDTPHN